MLVYLAGPIDQVAREDARGWREQVAEVLGTLGLATFSPAHAFNGPGRTDGPALRAINRAAITASEAVLVVWYKGEFAFETIREIEFARSREIPVFVYTVGWVCNSLGLFDLGNHAVTNTAELQARVRQDFRLTFGQRDQHARAEVARELAGQ